MDFVALKHHLGSSHISKFGRSWLDGKRISVQCSPLGKLVGEAGMGPGTRGVDFLSVDVEGAELAVLESFDWAIPVDVACVEISDWGGAGGARIKAETAAKVAELMQRANLKPLPDHLLEQAEAHLLSPNNTWFFSAGALGRVERTIRESAARAQAGSTAGVIGAVQFKPVPHANIDFGHQPKSHQPKERFQPAATMKLRVDSSVCAAYSYNIHG